MSRTKSKSAYDYHPASEVFRLLDGEEFETIVNSIREFGQLEPIVLYEGKILDGRNRYRACLRLDMRPKFRQLTRAQLGGMSPYEFVACLNSHRRHDDYNERVLAAGKIKLALQAETTHNSATTPKTKDPAHAPAARDTRAIAAESAGVGVKAADLGARIVEQGSAELQKKVAAGEVSPTAASKVLDLPKAQQVAAATRPAQNGQPKADVRVWDRFDEAFGKLRRVTDEIHRGFPHQNNHRSATGHLNAAYNVVQHWKKHVRG